MEDIINQLSKPSLRLVGTKQVIKGMINGAVRCVIVAKDAESYLKKCIVDTAKEHNVTVKYCESMQKLGNLCGIEVPSAVAGILAEA